MRRAFLGTDHKQADVFNRQITIQIDSFYSNVPNPFSSLNVVFLCVGFNFSLAAMICIICTDPSSHQQQQQQKPQFNS
jgi:hypothetical protein